MSNPNPLLTSGPAALEHWYDFADGGPVQRVLLPFPAARPAPFEVARWSVAPDTSNDREAHRSREVWIIVSGVCVATWGDRTTELRAGDVLAIDSGLTHQIRNPGPEPLHAISIYWLPD